jgi:uncharacterized protein YbjT (DUF2867 family)
VRAIWFAQNFDGGLFLPAVLAGEVALPVGDMVEPFVDANDLAEVAVTALLGDGHRGRTYETANSRLMTFAAAVEKLVRRLRAEGAVRPRPRADPGQRTFS